MSGRTVANREFAAAVEAAVPERASGWRRAASPAVARTIRTSISPA